MTGTEEMELRDYLRVLRRRWRSLLLGILVTVALTAVVVTLMPRSYRSTATLHLDRQAVPEGWISGAAMGFLGERLHALNQRVGSYENLRAIARKYPIFPPGWEQDPAWLQNMRDAITVERVDVEVSDLQRGRAMLVTVALNVSFDGPSPEVAQQVAQTLATLYVQESSDTRRAQAAAVVGFLAEEAQRLGERISDLEQKLSEFKSENLESLPELVAANRSLYDRTLGEVALTREAISSLEQRRISLSTRLAGTPRDADLYTDTGRRVTSSDERLRLLRAQYAQALTTYTDEHPEVLFFKREIEAMEAARANAAGSEESAAPTNPAYIALQSELAAVDTDLRIQRAKLTQLQDTVSGYERRLFAAPGVEKEYMPLIRERDSLNLKYREVSNRLLEAQMAAQLEGQQVGDRFYLVRPASLPNKPNNPGPLALMLFGTVLSVGSGVGAAAFGEYADRTVRGREGVRSVLNAAPLVVMPTVMSREDRAARRRRIGWLLGSTVVLIVALGLLGLIYLGDDGIAALGSAVSDFAPSLSNSGEFPTDAGAR